VAVLLNFFSLLCLTMCITSSPPSGGEVGEEGGRRREGTTVQLLGLTGGLATSSKILPGTENRTNKKKQFRGIYHIVALLTIILNNFILQCRVSMYQTKLVTRLTQRTQLNICMHTQGREVVNCRQVDTL
jgi:hypothetical protein